MKKLLGVLFLFIFLGCGKNSESPSPESTCLPSSINRLGNNLVFLYYYDNQGRVTKVRTSNYTFIVEYDNNGFFDYQEGYEQGRANITLDAQGRITRFLRGQNGTDAKFSYNNEGYLSKSSFYSIHRNETFSDEYSYTDGNLTSIVVTDNKGVKVTSNIEYESKKNSQRIAEYIFNARIVEETSVSRFMLGPMMGKQINNLPKRITGKQITDFAYEFDSQGRVIKLTASDATTTNKKETYVFTYENCR